MSFINWGEESSEQLAVRKRMEETIMFEQATYNAAMEAAAASAGTGGTKSNTYVVNGYVEDDYFE
jgi:hypothetical protein